MQQFNSSRFQERTARRQKQDSNRDESTGKTKEPKLAPSRDANSPDRENQYPEVDMDDRWDDSQEDEFIGTGDADYANESDISSYRNRRHHRSSGQKIKPKKQPSAFGRPRNGLKESKISNIQSDREESNIGVEYPHDEQEYIHEYPEPDSQFDGDDDRYSEDIRSGRIVPLQDQHSVSDYGARSVADSNTPRELGGETQAFWNPELEPEMDVRGTIPPISSSPQQNRLQKFLASFRRPKTQQPNSAAPASARQSTANNTTTARVVMLDGVELSFTLDRNDIGHALLTQVCRNADLVEVDYFGLTFVSNRIRTWFWLDLEKKISKQLRDGEQWLFSFQVKFYPPEPNLLQEDITRYQLTLQMRQDIYTGKLPCSWVTQALLGSFMVQAELGDYDSHDHGRSIEYLKELDFVPSPTPQLLHKIAELHKTHAGMKPNQADIKYLETAKRLELYGVDLHPVRDTENVEIYMGVGFHGIFIYRDRLRIGRFAWPKVLRISYKKNNFYIKIRPDNTEPVEAVIGFRLMNHHLAKRLWKAAVDHHTFFRLKESHLSNASGVLGDQYTYSGRTFFQYRTMNINRDAPQFDRSLVKRQTASMPTGLNKSVSLHTLNRAHPRDMTIGRRQENGSLSRPPAENKVHARSTGQLHNSLPRSSTLTNLENRSNISGKPPTGSVLTSEVSNRHRDDRRVPADNSSRRRQPHWHQEELATSDVGGSDSGMHGEYMNTTRNQDRGQSRRVARDNRPQQLQAPTSPSEYANRSQWHDDGDIQSVVSSSLTNQSADLQHGRQYDDEEEEEVIHRNTGATALPRRKPPSGGVPALGGLMLSSTKSNSNHHSFERDRTPAGITIKPKARKQKYQEVPSSGGDNEDYLEFVEDDRQYPDPRNNSQYMRTHGNDRLPSSRQRPSSNRQSNSLTHQHPEQTELML